MSSLINLGALILLFFAFGWEVAIIGILVKVILTKMDFAALGTLINAVAMVYCTNALWHMPFYNVIAFLFVVLCIVVDTSP